MDERLYIVKRDDGLIYAGRDASGDLVFVPPDGASAEHPSPRKGELTWAVELASGLLYHGIMVRVLPEEKLHE